MINNPTLQPVRHDNDPPALSTKDRERMQLEAETASYLARGGEIRQVQSISIDAVPWPSTDKQAFEQLQTINQLALKASIHPEIMVTLAREPGFPQAYMYKGQIMYTKSAFEAYQRMHKVKLMIYRRSSK